MKFFLLLISVMFCLMRNSFLSAQECCPSQCCCYPCGFFYGDISFLYWHASMDDLEYAAVLDTTIIDPDLTPPKDVFSEGSLKNVNFSWDPGIRASLGYNSFCCDWNFLLSGTYFHSKSTGSSTVNPIFTQNFLSYQVPLVTPEFMGNIAIHASAEWKLDFGYVDLLTWSCFSGCGCVNFMPNFGLRGCWIEQHYKANYNDVAFTTPDETVLADHTDTEYHTRYRAIGLKGGCDFEVPIFCNFNFYGGVGGSLLYGCLNANDIIHGMQLEASTEGPVLTTVGAHLKNENWLLRANLEAEIGLSYIGCCQCFNYIFSAGYLFSIWFDQNDFANFIFTHPAIASGLSFQNFPVLNRAHGNLQLQGLILTAGITF